MEKAAEAAIGDVAGAADIGGRSYSCFYIFIFDLRTLIFGLRTLDVRCMARQISIYLLSVLIPRAGFGRRSIYIFDVENNKKSYRQHYAANLANYSSRRRRPSTTGHFPPLGPIKVTNTAPVYDSLSSCH